MKPIHLNSVNFQQIMYSFYCIELHAYRWFKFTVTYYILSMAEKINTICDKIVCMSLVPVNFSHGKILEARAADEDCLSENPAGRNIF